MKNWKTTLIGIGLGALQAYLGGFHWQSAVLGAATAGLGLIANDPEWLGGSPTAPTPPSK